MVCVPCFIIPVLLFVWHRFILPYVLRFWNPWAKKDADGKVIEGAKTEFPFECAGGVCPFPKKATNTPAEEPTVDNKTDSVTQSVDKKND